MKTEMHGNEGGRDAAPATSPTGTAGDVVVCAPNEMHGVRAGSEELLLLATITPRPGAR